MIFAEVPFLHYKRIVLIDVRTIQKSSICFMLAYKMKIYGEKNLCWDHEFDNCLWVELFLKKVDNDAWKIKNYILLMTISFMWIINLLFLLIFIAHTNYPHKLTFYYLKSVIFNWREEIRSLFSILSFILPQDVIWSNISNCCCLCFVMSKPNTHISKHKLTGGSSMNATKKKREKENHKKKYKGHLFLLK